MKTWLDDNFQMPDLSVSLLIRFLEQNMGRLSDQAREKEFKDLTEEDILEIESYFNKVFRV
jgi:hypothetical protein